MTQGIETHLPEPMSTSVQFVWPSLAYVLLDPGSPESTWSAQHLCVHVCSAASLCVQLFVTLWTVAHQSPLSMGFSRQEYWSGFPCPPPEDLPNPGIEPYFLCLLRLQVDSLSTESPGKPSISESWSILGGSCSCFPRDLGQNEETNQGPLGVMGS